MRGIIVGGMAIVMLLGAHGLAAADGGAKRSAKKSSAKKASAKKATSQLDYRAGNRKVMLDRDAHGRWRRTETTRLELEVVHPRTATSPTSIYRAPMLVQLDVVRRLGRKLANREGGTVTIVCHGPDVHILTFAPQRVAMAR